MSHASETGQIVELDPLGVVGTGAHTKREGHARAALGHEGVWGKDGDVTDGRCTPTIGRDAQDVVWV